VIDFKVQVTLASENNRGPRQATFVWF